MVKSVSVYPLLISALVVRVFAGTTPVLQGGHSSCDKLYQRWDTPYESVKAPSYRAVRQIGKVPSTLIAPQIPAVIASNPDDRWWDTQFGPPAGDTLLVQAIITKGDTVIIGGYFRTIQGIEVNSIALWDGTQWMPLIPGGVRSTVGQPGSVTAMTIAPNGDLIIAGQFATVGGVVAPNLVRYDWQSVTPIPATFSGGITSMVFIGRDLYVGGAFNSMNGVAGTRSIARWDGSAWHSVGGGSDDGNISVLYTDGTNLYAGGSFRSIGGVSATAIARWDGMQWHAMGEAFRAELPNVTPQVLDIDQLPSGQLVIGGDFYRSGNQLVRYLAVWNGTSWQELGPPDGMITALTVWEGRLYISGGFEKIGSADIAFAAYWDGSQWNPMEGERLTSTLMVLHPSALGVLGGGSFELALDNGFTLRGLALWNGAMWGGIGGNRGNGADGAVLALAGDDEGNVYALGTFNRIGPAGPARIARFTGTRWEAVGNLPFNQQQRPFHLLIPYRDRTFVLAAVFTLDGQVTSAVMQYDPHTTTATPIGRVGGPVGARAIYALAYDRQRDLLYCGGNFRTMNNDTVRGIAVYDGQRWRALGTGLSGGQINAIAVLGDGSVVAAGAFSTIGGVSARSIARWNGSTWQPLGEGISLGGQQGTVNALWVEGRSLYVAGNFDRAGTIPCANIACWDLDSESWQPVGGGTNGTIYALHFHNGELIAGGEFSQAGNTAASRIARYIPETGQWRPMGSGIEGGAVRALVSTRKGLYVGGNFDRAGGRPSQAIARWLAGLNSIESPTSRTPLEELPLTVYPNPVGVSERATAIVRLATAGMLIIEAYTLDGRRQGILWSGYLEAGEHHCILNGDAIPAGGAVIVARREKGQIVGRTIVVRDR
ncbi:MAG: hypothetical protein RML15_06255 [Bacteroidota bacterium]|nr:hypothetical protein [Candidatus Kapabacteria bacterium]MCX7937449.1 hypothetical protein [Chlorobiota bacterium]MDW8271994.1 hypothetical protein [Bacteroidota bacterium]